MRNQLYKDLVAYLAHVSYVIEVSVDYPLDDPIYKEFILAHRLVQDDIADLLLKAEPNRLETTTYQNWDN